jgi:8-oxo-dGTP diphosphatase
MGFLPNDLTDFIFKCMHYPSEQGYIQQVAISCVIFGYQHHKLKVLISKLQLKGDFWNIPSGFVYQDEDIDDAAQRIIQERTGIQDAYLEQFQVLGKANRNNKAFLDRLIELNPEKLGENQRKQKEYDWYTRRSISIGYYAVVDISKVIPQKHDIDELIAWYDIDALPPLIMDHNEIVAKAVDFLRTSLDSKGNVFHLLPETFTMKEVQELYEDLLDKQFARNNFQKKILEMNVLERLEKKFTGAANKAPFLYRLPKETVAESILEGEELLSI